MVKKNSINFEELSITYQACFLEKTYFFFLISDKDNSIPNNKEVKFLVT